LRRSTARADPWIDFTIDGRDDEGMWGRITTTPRQVVDSWGDEWGVHHIYACFTISDGVWRAKL
jgi:hypothetical protein